VIADSETSSFPPRAFLVFPLRRSAMATADHLYLLHDII
jgi:hypothetical protein